MYPLGQMHFLSPGNPTSQCWTLIWNQKAASALEEQTYLQLFRSLCTTFFHNRGVRIIQKQSSKQNKYMSEKALWLVAYTITQDESEVSLYPSFQASALQCALPPWKMVKHKHFTELQRGPRSWTKTKEPQQAVLPRVCQRQTLQSSDVWRKGRRTAPAPAKIPTLEVLTWQKESDRRSRQCASAAQFPAQPLHLPSSAGLGSTPSSENNFLKIRIFMGIVSFRSLTQVLNLQVAVREPNKNISQFDSMHKKLWLETIKRQAQCTSYQVLTQDASPLSPYRAGTLQTRPSKLWWATEHATHVCW